MAQDVSVGMFRQSLGKFLAFGGTHAQFIGVLVVTAGGLIVIGSKGKGWSEEAQRVKAEMGAEAQRVKAEMGAEIVKLQAEADKAQTKIRAAEDKIVAAEEKAQAKIAAAEAKIAAAEAKIAAARAEAIQQTSDRFLMYGYAAEYAEFQKKALGQERRQD